MKKNNPRIKEQIMVRDEIHAIEHIADSCFTGGGNYRKYTPYYTTVGETEAIVKFFLEGVEFDDGENIYEIAMNDFHLRPLVDSFYIRSEKDKRNPSDHQLIFGRVMNYVTDIVNYKQKENLVHLYNKVSKEEV